MTTPIGTTRAGSRPDILSDSTMWQSPRWSESADTVFDRSPRHRLLNHPIALAVRLLLRRRRYRVVVTTGNKTALLYGLLCRLLFLPQKQVVAQLYLDDRGSLGKILDPLQAWVLRGADGVLVPSRGEIPLVEERFGVARDRIRFVPYHTNLIEPENLGSDGAYIFSGGRNFRDYKALVEAVDGTGVETVIVCGADQLVDRPLPRNVTVRREIPWEQYIELLRGASVAVVPLNTEIVPSGQVAILEATAYGKPVITARSVGTVDYVEHGQDGLLYTTGDPEDLRAQILRLTTDDEFRHRLGNAAFRRTVEQFTFDVHVAAKVEAIQSLAAASRPADR